MVGKVDGTMRRIPPGRRAKHRRRAAGSAHGIDQYPELKCVGGLEG
jgi:hypothetical protein